MFASVLWALFGSLPIWSRVLLGVIPLVGVVPLFGPMRLPVADLVAGTTLTRGKSPVA
jgi:hypothetical protein